MKKITALFITLSVPAVYMAQGFQVNLQGQKQQGMGGAGTAYMQDAAAVFFNPGGMSFLKENSVTVGATATIANSTYLDKNSSVTNETKSPVSFPFTAYGVYGKAESRFKFGLGVYTPFGSTVKWEDGWSGRYALTELKLLSVFVQPTLSYKINEKWGVGAGFVYGYGKVNLQRDIPVVDNNGNTGHAELDGSANGFGFNAGIYFKPTEKFSIGLTYRSQVNMSVDKGDATFTVPASLSTNFPNGNFSASLPLPQIISLGFAYNINEKLTLALDGNFAGWSSYKNLEFDYEKNTSSLSDTKSARNYENTFAIRLGGQYKVTDKFAARLGISYSQTPIQDGYVTPEVPDANRLNYTAGIGYKFSDHFGADVSFTLELFEREDHNLETNLNGTYKTAICAPGLSLYYNF